MSDRDDKIGDVAQNNSIATQLVRTLVDVTAASFATALANISGVVSLIGLFISTNNQVPEALDEIKTALNSLLQAVDNINASLRWSHIVGRWKDIDNAFIPANSVLDLLEADVNNLAQLSYGDKSDRIAKCAETLESLQNSANWKLFWSDPVYYQDDYNRQSMPMPDSDGSVFSPAYVLPQYVRALAIYLLVMRSIASEDIQYHSKDLKKFVNFLRDAHDRSAAGIVQTSVPTRGGGGSPIGIGGNATGYRSLGLAQTPYADVPPFHSPDEPFLWGRWDFGHDSSAYWDDTIEYYQPVGAVHAFSGASAITKVPPLVAIMSDFFSEYSPTYSYYGLFFYYKLQLASLVRGKEVYRSVGLVTVWDTIDQVGRMIGDSPIGKNRASWWSLREIRDFVPSYGWDWSYAPPMPGEEPSSTLEISAANLLLQLYALYGIPKKDDSGQSLTFLSFRKALDAAALRENVNATRLEDWWGCYLPNQIDFKIIVTTAKTSQGGDITVRGTGFAPRWGATISYSNVPNHPDPVPAGATIYPDENGEFVYSGSVQCTSYESGDALLDVEVRARDGFSRQVATATISANIWVY
jgi:hypothetical protein